MYCYVTIIILDVALELIGNIPQSAELKETRRLKLLYDYFLSSTISQFLCDRYFVGDCNECSQILN